MSGIERKYKIGVICALSKERRAVQYMLTKTHKLYHRVEHDDVVYTLGEMAEMYVVVGSLPEGSYGTTRASDVAVNMKRSFASVQFWFLVGIAGATPIPTNPDQDVRLGDVVIGTHVHEYDYGKLIADGTFVSTRNAQEIDKKTRSMFSAFRSHNADPDISNEITSCLQRMSQDEMQQWTRPQSDVLYCTLQEEQEQKQEQKRIVTRNERKQTRVFYGSIASSNALLKNAAKRDMLADNRMLCVEMEAAGVYNSITECICIRGICDYADNNKNDEWQNYAALSAAAFFKLFALSMLPTMLVSDENTLSESKRDEIPSGINDVVNGMAVVNIRQQKNVIDNMEMDQFIDGTIILHILEDLQQTINLDRDRYDVCVFVEFLDVYEMITSRTRHGVSFELLAYVMSAVRDGIIVYRRDLEGNKELQSSILEIGFNISHDGIKYCCSPRIFRLGCVIWSCLISNISETDRSNHQQRICQLKTSINESRIEQPNKDKWLTFMQLLYEWSISNRENKFKIEKEMIKMKIDWY